MISNDFNDEGTRLGVYGMGAVSENTLTEGILKWDSRFVLNACIYIEKEAIEGVTVLEDIITKSDVFKRPQDALVKALTKEVVSCLGGVKEAIRLGFVIRTDAVQEVAITQEGVEVACEVAKAYKLYDKEGDIVDLELVDIFATLEFDVSSVDIDLLNLINTFDLSAEVLSVINTKSCFTKKDFSVLICNYAMNNKMAVDSLSQTIFYKVNNIFDTDVMYFDSLGVFQYVSLDAYLIGEDDSLDGEIETPCTVGNFSGADAWRLATMNDSYDQSIEFGKDGYFVAVEGLQHYVGEDVKIKAKLKQKNALIDYFRDRTIYEVTKTSLVYAFSF